MLTATVPTTTVTILGQVINRIGKIADFGHIQCQGFGKRAAHPHPIFMEVPPGGLVHHRALIMIIMKLKRLRVNFQKIPTHPNPNLGEQLWGKMLLTHHKLKRYQEQQGTQWNQLQQLVTGNVSLMQNRCFQFVQMFY